MDNISDYFLKYLYEYNQTWVNKDLKKLKKYYDTENNRLIYYDNHKDNDTYTLDKHLALVSDFFTKRKRYRIRTS